jgi:hypothetical protein
MSHRSSTASPSPDRLAALVAQVRRTTETSTHLISQAAAVCLESAQAIGARRVSREARAAWIEILSHVSADPDHPVIVCARCHQAKSDGHWISLPPGIETR